MSLSERISRNASAAKTDRGALFWDRIGQLIDRHRNYSDAEWATLLLREKLAEVAPELLDDSPASGCCGCGSWLADVCTHPSEGYPSGESYCWKCVDRKGIDGYRVLPGCER